MIYDHTQDIYRWTRVFYATPSTKAIRYGIGFSARVSLKRPKRTEISHTSRLFTEGAPKISPAFRFYLG